MAAPAWHVTPSDVLLMEVQAGQPGGKVRSELRSFLEPAGGVRRISIIIGGDAGPQKIELLEFMRDAARLFNQLGYAISKPTVDGTQPGTTSITGPRIASRPCCSSTADGPPIRTLPPLSET